MVQTAIPQTKERKNTSLSLKAQGNDARSESWNDADSVIGVPLFMQHDAAAFTKSPPIQRLVATSGQEASIESNFAIGQPNDSYEQEAERIAEHIVQKREPGVQRKPT